MCVRANQSESGILNLDLLIDGQHQIHWGNIELIGHVISSLPSNDSTSDLCLPTTTPHCQDTTALCTVAAATLNQHTPFYLCMCVYICDSATVPSWWACVFKNWKKQTILAVLLIPKNLSWFFELIRSVVFGDKVSTHFFCSNDQMVTWVWHCHIDNYL